MRGIKYILLLLSALLFTSCTDSPPNGMKKIHWDRDMCERCQMVISEKHFAVQIINPDTNKAHMFDDIGCAVLWFKEENKNWFDKAKIWISDAQDTRFLDAKTSIYTTGNLTPMGYGLNAYSNTTKPKDKKHLNFDDAVKNIEAKDAAYQKKREEARKKREEQKSE